MAVTLFVDMLGARQKWQAGGVPAAIESFNHFARMVVAATRSSSPKSVLRGGVETDSAMLVFDSPVPAFLVASQLFRFAFKKTKNPTAPRLWLRGSMVADSSEAFIRRGTRMANQFENVEVFTYSEPALDAISIEKSGFKGMRLLVKAELITSQVKAALRIPFGTTYFTPIRRLRHSGYPLHKEDLMDFLWMACGDDQDWSDISLHMTYRLRHSAHNPEEFAQAAATQVVFHECAALRQGAISRAARLEEEKVNKKKGKS